MQEFAVHAPLSTSLGLAARRTGTLALAVTALWMAGCASKVKLDEPKQQAPIVNSSANTSTAPATTVAPVTAGDATGNAEAGLARAIYFDYDSFVVKEEYRPTIEGYAKLLNGNKGKRLTIEGHTDERGGREYNLALGQKRAEATLKSLTLLGVAGDQLEAVSFGEERPSSEGSSEDAWAKNRRAEFKTR